MNAETAPANNEDRSQINDQPRQTLRASHRRGYYLGCTAGCPQDHHECGLGRPLPALPEPGPFERAGRDLTWPERERLGTLWLEQGRAA